MMICFYPPGYINIFSILMTEALLSTVAFLVILAAITIFFSQRIKKLKAQLHEFNTKSQEMEELFNNAEQLNKNLVQENIMEKEQNELIIAKMSYEIHHCVNGIMGMANLLKDTDIDTEQLNATDVIIQRTKMLLESAHDSFNTEPDAQKSISTLENSKLNDWEKSEMEKISKEFYQKFPFSILVAEDDAINQQLAIRLLSKLGYTADIASNGKEALDMVSERNYDIILMDVLMPEMDGFEATKMIRLCLDVQPIIIAVTASAMSGDKDKCLEVGMDDYICKPIIIEELALLFEKWGKEKKATLY